MSTGVYNTLKNSPVNLSCFNFPLGDSDGDWETNQLLVRYFLRFTKSILLPKGVAELKLKPMAYFEGKARTLKEYKTDVETLASEEGFKALLDDDGVSVHHRHHNNDYFASLSPKDGEEGGRIFYSPKRNEPTSTGKKNTGKKKKNEKKAKKGVDNLNYDPEPAVNYYFVVDEVPILPSQIHFLQLAILSFS